MTQIVVTHDLTLLLRILHEFIDVRTEGGRYEREKGILGALALRMYHESWVAARNWQAIKVDNWDK